MAARLHLKIGVVPDQDRLDTSPDTVLVTEPSVGSTLRSKGSLYTIVTAPSEGGGRPDQASLLVAETIRREYYYDESAGIPICLEKAIRSANRRLRHQREGHGIAPGSIGAVIAVVRGQELYVATIGDADAFLVRQARLLTLPEADRGKGLPTPDEVDVDVWRGELAFGDSLLLVARNVTQTVGTDELKNALVTLHPQSAVEHLHHLFVAAGGEGSDALLALEVTELAATRSERRLVPVRPADPLAGAPDRGPIPLADGLVEAATAVQGGATRARVAAGRGFRRLIHRVTDRFPRRRPRYRRVTSMTSRRETQRRLGVAALASVLLLGGLVVGFNVAAGLGRGADAIPGANEAERAFATMNDRLDEVYGDGRNLVRDDPRRAKTLLREAWAELNKAASLNVAEAQLRAPRQRIVGGLNELYAVRANASRVVVSFPSGADVTDLTAGPATDPGAVYVVDDGSKAVIRVDVARGTTRPVVNVGDGRGEGIGEPWMLSTAGPDVLIVDRSGGVWRWRPSDTTGNGTLAPLRIGGEVTWGDDITDVGTFVRNSEAGLYNLYVVDPSSRQILRYSPAQDGSGFPSPPSGYLVTATDVSGFEQVFIDGDLYALTADGITRYDAGVAQTSFKLAVPEDDVDLRPGHKYELFTASPAEPGASESERRQGQIYVWDARHRRVLVFDKTNGAYREQFIPRTPTPQFQDIRGVLVREGSSGQPATLLWVTSDRLLASPLVNAAPTTGSPAPRPTRSARPAASPTAP